MRNVSLDLGTKVDGIKDDSNSFPSVDFPKRNHAINKNNIFQQIINIKYLKNEINESNNISYNLGENIKKVIKNAGRVHMRKSSQQYESDISSQNYQNQSYAAQNMKDLFLNKKFKK